MEQASYSICHHLFHYYPSQDTGAPGDGNEISVDFGEAEKQTNNQKKKPNTRNILAWKTTIGLLGLTCDLWIHLSLKSDRVEGSKLGSCSSLKLQWQINRSKSD